MNSWCDCLEKRHTRGRLVWCMKGFLSPSILWQKSVHPSSIVSCSRGSQSESSVLCWWLMTGWVAGKYMWQITNKGEHLLRHLIRSWWQVDFFNLQTSFPASFRCCDHIYNNQSTSQRAKQTDWVMAYRCRYQKTSLLPNTHACIRVYWILLRTYYFFFNKEFKQLSNKIFSVMLHLLQNWCNTLLFPSLHTWLHCMWFIIIRPDGQQPFFFKIYQFLSCFLFHLVCKTL